MFGEENRIAGTPGINLCLSLVGRRRHCLVGCKKWQNPVYNMKYILAVVGRIGVSVYYEERL